MAERVQVFVAKSGGSLLEIREGAKVVQVFLPAGAAQALAAGQTSWAGKGVKVRVDQPMNDFSWLEVRTPNVSLVLPIMENLRQLFAGALGEVPAEA